MREITLWVADQSRVPNLFRHGQALSPEVVEGWLTMLGELANRADIFVVIPVMDTDIEKRFVARFGKEHVVLLRPNSVNGRVTDAKITTQLRAMSSSLMASPPLIPLRWGDTSRGEKTGLDEDELWVLDTNLIGPYIASPKIVGGEAASIEEPFADHSTLSSPLVWPSRGLCCQNSVQTEQPLPPMQLSAALDAQRGRWKGVGNAPTTPLSHRCTLEPVGRQRTSVSVHLNAQSPVYDIPTTLADECILQS